MSQQHPESPSATPRITKKAVCAHDRNWIHSQALATMQSLFHGLDGLPLSAALRALADRIDRDPGKAPDRAHILLARQLADDAGMLTASGPVGETIPPGFLRTTFRQSHRAMQLAMDEQRGPDSPDRAGRRSRLRSFELSLEIARQFSGVHARPDPDALIDAAELVFGLRANVIPLPALDVLRRVFSDAYCDWLLALARKGSDGARIPSIPIDELMDLMADHPYPGDAA